MSILQKRQGYGSDPGGDGNIRNGPWWYTGSGYATRYGITAAVIIAIFLYFFLSYLHGKRRVRKGLPLLAYHRWMFRSNGSRQYTGRSLYDRQRNDFGAFGGPREGYQMNNWRQAPPRYQNQGVWRSDGHDGADGLPAYNADIPPAYVPPPGGSKTAPEQAVHPVGDDEHRENDEAGSSMRPPGNMYPSSGRYM